MSVLIDYNKGFDKFLETKPKTSYPKNVMKEIRILQAGKDDVNIFGSVIYRIQSYAADIDLLEEYSQKGTVDTIVKNFAKQLQAIVKRVKSEKSHYYSEVKCGSDDRYNIDIGTLSNGRYSINPNLIQIITNYFKSGLLHLGDYNHIIKNITSLQNISVNQADVYDNIHGTIRNYHILRWTREEILQGFKNVINRRIKLLDALKMDDMVKIDEITVLNSRTVEITNIYFLSVINPDGTLVPINPAADPIDSLKGEVEKLYYSNMYYSPFKMIKRIYALSRMLLKSPGNNYSYADINDVLKKIFPFISSSMSALYQMKSELDTINILLENYPRIGVIGFNNQIDNMRLRLASILEIKEETLVIMQNIIIKIVDEKNQKKKVELIDNLVKYIKQIINFNTISYLNKVQLNPLPSFLLPTNPKYNRSIIRSPTD